MHQAILKRKLKKKTTKYIPTDGMMPESTYAITKKGSTEPVSDTISIEESNNPSANVLRTERDFADEGGLMNAKTKLFIQVNDVFVALGIDPVPTRCRTLASIISISNEWDDLSQSQIHEPVLNADSTLPILFMNKTETGQNFHEQIPYGIFQDKTLTLFPALNVATVECYPRIVSDGSEIVTGVIAEFDTIHAHNFADFAKQTNNHWNSWDDSCDQSPHHPVDTYMISSLFAKSLLQTVSDDIFSPMMTSAQFSTSHLTEKKREELVHIRIYPDERTESIIEKFGLLNTLEKNDGRTIASTCLDNC
jgi:hypothetical protein